MNARNGIIAGTFLLGAALLLAFAAWFRRCDGGPESGGEPAPPAAEPAARPAPQEIRVELAAKNLFHPLRGAPPPEEKKEAAARNEPPANFTLTGIFGFGEERGAVITSGGAPAAAKPGAAPRKIFRTGADVGGGYVLSEVRADCAVLVRGTDKMILRLYQKQERTMREKKQ